MFLRFFRKPGKDLENHLTEPFKIVTVNAQGKWSTFSPELSGPQFWFGDLSSGPISSHLAHSRFLEVHKAIQSGVEKCRKECEYFPVCGGGAPSNKYAELGRFDVTETAYCRAMVKCVADACMNSIGRYVVRPGTRGEPEMPDQLG
jgi:uncharacterized protein